MGSGGLIQSKALDKLLGVTVCWLKIKVYVKL